MVTEYALLLNYRQLYTAVLELKPHSQFLARVLSRKLSITPIENPKHLVNLEGKGNKLWDAIKATKR